MKKFIALLLMISPAMAQDATPPPKMLTPSELAIQLDTAINQMAAALEEANKENADLRKQLEQAKKK